jgi:hypothetical protein
MEKDTLRYHLLLGDGVEAGTDIVILAIDDLPVPAQLQLLPEEAPI